MQRVISTGSLLLVSISAILGSGWLFTPFLTLQHAGPAALLSWVVGAIFSIILGLAFAEICTTVPICGASSRISHYTHGNTVSFVYAWIIWLSYVALPPIEVQSILQYIDFLWPGLTGPSGELSFTGYIWATALMLLMCTINAYAVRWVIRVNSLLTLLKLMIPGIISLVVMIYFFTPSQVLHPADSEFMPFGLEGMLSAISLGGIIYAFTGFKQAAELAGETKNPGRSIPIAIVGSVLICALLFLLIQIAFLSSLTEADLAGGWANLSIEGATSPIAGMLTKDGLSSMLPILYIGAIISPFAAGLMYCAGAGRTLYAMAGNGYLPQFLYTLTPTGNPRHAIIVNFIVGMTLFAPLPGWSKMASFLTSLMSITYSIAPACLIILRQRMPADHPRPFKLPCLRLWASICMIICTFMTYWNGWDILSKLGIAIGVGLAVLLGYRTYIGDKSPLNLKPALWMLVYFPGLLLISYFGHFGNGLSLLLSPYDNIAIIILSLVSLWLSVRFTLSTPEISTGIQTLIKDAQPIDNFRDVA